MINLNEVEVWHDHPPEGDVVRVLCFDPALSRCGWSVLELKLNKKKKKGATDLNVTVIRFGNIRPGNEAKKVAYREPSDEYGRRMVSLLLLRNDVKSLVNEFKPHYVVSEAAFFFKKFPSAYAALEQCILTIRFACKDFFNLPLHTIPTRSAKKSLTGTGSAGKVDVITAILENPDIKFRQRHKAKLLDEHSADSIAVGWCFLSEVWPNLVRGGVA